MIFLCALRGRILHSSRVAGVLVGILCVCLILSCTPAPGHITFLETQTQPPIEQSKTLQPATPTIQAPSQPTTSPAEQIAPSEKISYPSFAGSWYSAGPERLAADVDGYLDATRSVDGAPIVLIVPEIQYGFSGLVSASAYKQLLTASYETAIILTTAVYPPHPNPIAVWDDGTFETPIGRIEVDRELAQSIISADILIKSDERVFSNESGIEIQLPFLQRVCPKCRIVPILIDNENEEAALMLARVLSQVMSGRKTVLIAGSNLSQYPSQYDGMPVDNEIMNAIETGRPEEFSETIRKCLAKNIPNLTSCAYGEMAIRTAMNTASLLGAETVSLLNYGNSGDSPNGDPNRATGYGAVMFWHFEPPNIDEENQKFLLSLARNVLQNHISDEKVNLPIPDDPIYERKIGAFVILKLDDKIFGSMGHMRADLPLNVVVQEMALAALTANPRSVPLTSKELERLKIEISITTPPNRLDNIDDIVIGKHGLLIQERNHQGVLLPQVQIENQWGRYSFLDHICLVASMPENCWQNRAVIYTFRTITFGD